jgi:uncharacterized protein (UPF0276 family)
MGASAIGIGFVLQPELEYLDLLAPVFGALVDYFEIAPETTWWATEEGGLLPNGFSAEFYEIGQRWAPAGARSKPFVAHGVGLSLGSADPGDRARQLRWLGRLEEDQGRFEFRWLSDHLAVTTAAGEALALPLPLLPTAAAAALVRGRLRELQARVVPDVAFENAAHYFYYGDPLAEAGLIAQILALPRSHVVLDLYNVWMMGQNMGFEPREFLRRLDLSRVIEIHVAGGSYSDLGWLPEGRRLRLDSHDEAVPEPVWALLAEVLPRCVNLRGVTLERMEGTVRGADVGPIAEELRRLRRAVEALA